MNSNKYKYTAAAITILLTLTTSACSKTIVMDLNRPEAKVTEKTIISNDSDDPFQNLYSFHFKLNEDTLHLLMSYGELLELGWSCGLNPEEQVLGSLGVPGVIFSKDNQSFAGTLLSTSDFYVDASELLLTSVTLSPELAPESAISLPKDILISEENKDSLKEKIGEPQDMVELEHSDTMWFYSYDIDENILFTLNSDNRVKEVTLTKYIENQIRTQVPEVIANYVRADKMSEDLREQTFEVDGVIYKMPTPVDQWIENGYSVQEAHTPLPGSKMLEPGDTTGCNLVNDDLEFYAIIENYGTEAQSFEKCHVARLTLSPVAGHTINLSPGLSFDISQEELQAIVSDYKNTQDKNDYFTSITIPISERSSTAFYIDTVSGELGLVEYLNYPE